MRFFSEDQVRQALKIDEVIAAIREAFARDFQQTLHMPVRSQLELEGAILLLMPCYDSALQSAGIKMVTVSPGAGVQATYALLDSASGKMLALMEANYLTDLRTAATSAVATDSLARQDAQTLGIFGTGRQARAHLAAMPHVRKFSRFLVCGSKLENAVQFCQRIKEEQGMAAEPADAERCARESDVICACTTAHEPLLDGAWLRPGTHLNLVGAFQPHTREVDDETVRRSRVVVDTYDGAMAEAGDLLIPLHRGVVGQEHIVADLHEIASGKKRGRTAASQITLFKSVGCALEDLVVARLAISTQQSAFSHETKSSM